MINAKLNEIVDKTNDPIAFAEFYLRLATAEKKTLQYLLHLYQKYGEASVYPSIRSIARFAGCTKRNIFLFLCKLRELGKRSGFILLKVIHQFRAGQQTSNRYKLNNFLKAALLWLQKRGWLNAPYHKIEFIISSMREDIKNVLNFTPNDSQTSPYTDSSYRDIRRRHHSEYSFGGLPLDSIAINASQRFSEYIISEAVRATQFAFDNNRIIKNVSAFFLGACKMFKKKFSC